MIFAETNMNGYLAENLNKIAAQWREEVSEKMAVLEFKNYKMGFRDSKGTVHNLIDDISFKVVEGRALGIVGESGCGKSMTSLSMMRLMPGNAVVQGGEIFLEGSDLLEKSEEEMQSLRGREMAMIFQEPMTSLNPVLTIGFQLSEALTTHFPSISKQEVHAKVIAALQEVGIPNPEGRFHQYAHEFSGGMRQRVMIAMAMLCKPKLLIADEPTTALDVTIQAQILELMKKLKKKGALLLVTHNLGVVAEVCEEVVVMYAGTIVEQGSLSEIFNHPLHPYTKGLMAAIPTLSTPKGELYTIPGTVPVVGNFPQGCRFSDRCEQRNEICSIQKPPRYDLHGKEHSVACWLLSETEGVSIHA